VKGVLTAKTAENHVLDGGTKPDSLENAGGVADHSLTTLITGSTPRARTT
jgi:hypothetical protein